MWETQEFGSLYYGSNPADSTVYNGKGLSIGDTYPGQKIRNQLENLGWPGIYTGKVYVD